MDIIGGIIPDINNPLDLGGIVGVLTGFLNLAGQIGNAFIKLVRKILKLLDALVFGAQLGLFAAPMIITLYFYIDTLHKMSLPENIKMSVEIVGVSLLLIYTPQLYKLSGLDQLNPFTNPLHLTDLGLDDLNIPDVTIGSGGGFTQPVIHPNPNIPPATDNSGSWEPAKGGEDSGTDFGILPITIPNPATIFF